MRFADGVRKIRGGLEAIEAKRIGNWATSPYNPANMGRSLGAHKQFSLATQMRDYSTNFRRVTYYTNDANMMAHLQDMARTGGFKNIRVRLF